MVGQCPVCKGYFGIQQEWVGQEAQCPHCQQTITVQTVETSGKDLSTETKKTNVLSLVLLIIGIINLSSRFLLLIWLQVSHFNESYLFYKLEFLDHGLCLLVPTESFFYKLWDIGLCILVPVIGCIVSIFYFKINSNKCKKIQWEYIGIVTSFVDVISFFIHKLFLINF